MNLIKSIESPSEVRQTWHLAHSVYFLPLRPSEVRRTSSGLVSPASPMLFCFTGLSPDLDRTSSGIWSSLTESIGSPTDCSAESIGIGWVRWKSIGIRRKRGGSVKYTAFPRYILSFDPFSDPSLSLFSLVVDCWLTKTVGERRSDHGILWVSRRYRNG